MMLLCENNFDLDNKNKVFLDYPNIIFKWEVDNKKGELIEPVENFIKDHKTFLGYDLYLKLVDYFEEVI